ncbi:rhamnulokinase family protein [uncultured Eubacterium sp.]|uniref:rhamnulokinase n=1 Tax=uncultured Eubacterium sp. TaxID=165185 RepID=UPI00262CDC4E|nr:rhamnulokinase family protein [uncultured Eubacterium sp.]
MTYYLAIDIGASSGRHILSHIENERLVLEEIYRFDNNLSQSKDGLIWDIESLFSEVLNGIKKCKEIGKIPKSIAIDTWGVDYVLLDENKKEIKPCYCYRDSRTNAVVDEVENLVSPARLYAKTGIQKQNFNTIYQLYADKKNGRLQNAKYFLMMPEYLSFKLTGVCKNEYTNATTTGLVNAKTKTWDSQIIHALGLTEDFFKPLFLPSSLVGDLSADIQKAVGFNCAVLFAPSHDTASAVCACPMADNDLYISSGTWSLIGTEITEPILSDNARQLNFTNEGGIDYRFRFLKNYMGMWLFQNIRRNLDKSMTYDEMMELAKNCGEYKYFDVNDSTLVSPKNMIDAIGKLIGSDDLGLILNSAYHSLAKSYSEAVTEIEAVTGKRFNAIHIVGGGCQDKYLNALTRDYTGKSVTAGPIEATATGNIVSQIMRDKKISLAAARDLIKNSFYIKEI